MAFAFSRSNFVQARTTLITWILRSPGASITTEYDPSWNAPGSTGPGTSLGSDCSRAGLVAVALQLTTTRNPAVPLWPPAPPVDGRRDAMETLVISRPDDAIFSVH